MGTFSTAKGYSLLSAGDNPGTWGAGASTALNEGVFQIIDNNMGGIVTKSVAGSPIPLTSDEAQNVIIRLIGAQSADIILTNPAIGFYIVENLTTGNFTVTVTNGVAGEIAQKGQSIFIADPTNGARVAATDSLPSGTRTAFNQATAPTGWVKDATIDNAAMRLSATGGGTGGASDFSDVFASRTILRANLPNFNLPVSDPGHSHPYTRYGNLINVGSGGSIAQTWVQTATLNTFSSFTGITVNSGGSGTGMDFAVKYYDFCVCTKS